MKEAYLYKPMENEGVRCGLCAHGCIIKPGAKGICGVRQNVNGKLYSLVYDKVIARHVDPIEKKPLFHFLPGTLSYSIATVGCNFRCKFCQNADISQMPSDLNRIIGENISPQDIVTDAQRSGCATIAYTYTEPTIYFELAKDTAEIASSKGIKNVFVSNGYMTKECLEQIHPHLHAANVDLKSFSDKFYKDMCKARLQPVLDTICTMKRQGIWVEVTTLIIPGKNDSREELRDIAKFLVELDPGIPWHVSRFHPTYRLTDVPPTPPRTVRMAREIGYETGLRYVYTGNLPGDEGEHTKCHNCGAALIERFGFYVRNNRIARNTCPSCGEPIPGVWETC